MPSTPGDFSFSILSMASLISFISTIFVNFSFFFFFFCCFVSFLRVPSELSHMLLVRCIIFDKYLRILSGYLRFLLQIFLVRFLELFFVFSFAFVSPIKRSIWSVFLRLELFFLCFLLLFLVFYSFQFLLVLFHIF